MSLIVTLEGAIAALALAFRFIAKHRWTGLDWTQCRRNIGDPAHS